jgi:DNA-binding LacI/PurR family transcriptional regulator
VDLVKNAPGFDACVIHPRLETLPLGLLAALRSRSRAVVVEGYSVEGVDVDGVAIDWNAAVAAGLRHLVELGHRRIGLMTIDRPVRAFSAVISQFRLLHSWANLDSSIDPVVLVPNSGEAEIYTNIAARLKAHADSLGRPAHSALLMFLGAYHGKPLLKALQHVAPDLSIAMLGFTDLAVEHAGHLTTIGQSTANVTEAVAAAIERRWAEPAAPYVSCNIAPELIVRSSTLEQREVA